MMSSDDASYFLNIAVIGGTLLALSFVTLQFFLEKLLKRYELVALPVFRSGDFGRTEEPSHLLALPDSLKDEELLDGDPLIIFMAFSVGVTWIQFLVPLTIGLSAAWLGEHRAILAVELAFLLGFFAVSFFHRNRAIKRLRPYLRREEVLWPALGGMLLGFYLVATAVTLASALSPLMHVPAFLTIWNRWGVSNEHASFFMLKFVCILSLLIGTYTTNKDMFIFFKSIGAEGMRQRWLDSFVRERYRDLQKTVNTAKSELGEEAREILLRKWNEGCPSRMASTHDAFRKIEQTTLTRMWREFVDGRTGSPMWLFDVPHIANWEAEVKEHSRTRLNRPKPHS
jgi:hypothetical protein